MEHSCVRVFAHHSKAPRFDPQLFKSTEHQNKWLKLRNAKWFFLTKCGSWSCPSLQLSCFAQHAGSLWTQLLTPVLTAQVCGNIKPGASVLACCPFHSPAGQRSLCGGLDTSSCLLSHDKGLRSGTFFPGTYLTVGVGCGGSDAVFYNLSWGTNWDLPVKDLVIESQSCQGHVDPLDASDSSLWLELVWKWGLRIPPQT